MILKEFAQKVQNKTKIPTFERGLERIFSAVISFKDIWSIIRYSKQPIKVVQETLKLLKENGLVEFQEGEIRLTSLGKKTVKELKIERVFRPECKKCQGRGINYQFDKKLYQQFLKIQKQRPGPIRAYSQGYVTPETTISRVLLARARGDLSNKKIAVLGAEDDLLGLALALTKKPKSVLVLDIDKRLIEYDNFWAKKLNLSLKAEVFDLRKPLDKNLIGRFDTFFTDPPETLSAIKGFILKGVATLKAPGCAGYFGFTIEDSSLNKWLKLQKILNDNRVVITEILPDFSEYENFEYLDQTAAFKKSPVQKSPSRIWYVSHWYRVVAMPGFKKVNLDLRGVGKKIYQDIESASD